MISSLSTSEKFLLDIIGIDQFKKLVNGERIIVHNDKFTYELCSCGRIINKNTSQEYCFLPVNSNNYPHFDILAIKYAYIKYGGDIVEKIACKKDLDARHDSQIVCPICHEQSEYKCKKHYVGNFLSRAQLFCNAVWDITGREIIFRCGKMGMYNNYGIIYSGNLEYSIDPQRTVKIILNNLLKEALKFNISAENKIKITDVYNKCISGESFRYTFKNGSRWDIYNHW